MSTTLLEDPASSLRRYRGPLIAILAAAFTLRLGIAALSPSIQYADEIYHVAEQANRAIHGYGIIPWEFRMASRTAMLAEMVVPIYWLSATPAVHQFLQAALFSAISLIPIWIAFQWTGRLYGGRAGCVAAILTATWFELVYFAPKATADVVGGYLLLAAVFFARSEATRRQVFLAGALLALTFGIRLQIAPAIAVVTLLTLWAGDARRRVAVAGGLACGLGIVGAAEWAWWGVPFRGQLGYLLMEFKYHASTYFTREPLTFFLKEYVLMYGGALPVMAALIVAGAKRAPILLITALAVVIPFHFIGHKEYRFVVAAVPTFAVLMSIGMIELTSRVAARPRRLDAAIVAGWLVAMAALSWGDHYRHYWTQSRNHVLAFRDIGQQSDACGVALAGVGWWQTPGYSGLGRDIPIYQVARDESLETLAPAANYVIAGPKLPTPPSSYVLWKEYSRPVERIYRRDGGCVPDPSAQVIAPFGIPGLPD